MPAGITQLQDLFQRILNLSVGIAFIVIFIMLVVTGIKFLTSGGEAKPLQSASQTLTWALLGILFLAIAWLVLKLIAAFTGIDILHICLSFPGSNGCPSP